ncbi:glycosyltransferase family 4 protein [Aliagarivorans taiwanensis]|uniref:glycosyltransferase family 4 protein n=1 Tax=Aliagarivorans taiwanensis TaxID=561966 RepID=UPI00146FBECF|nr:glycosyltransferase family 4 protein [Aliagarivorans taiwanensis]
MSSALTAFVEGLRVHHNVEYIATQIDRERLFQSWFRSAWHMLKQPKSYKGSVCWFHMGPWLSMIRKASLACLAKLFGAETIAHFHAISVDDYLNSRIGRLFVRAILLPFDQVVVLTPWWYERVYPFVGNKPVTIVANPVDHALQAVADHYNQHPKDEKGHSTTTVLSMTRLIEGKGLELVVECMPHLPEHFKLVIAGDGPLKPKLEELSKQLKINHRVTFTGWVAGEAKREIIGASDIFCLPSQHDSFGMVFIEAMAFDLPIVATHCGPIPDVVTSDVGLTIPPNSAPRALASALLNVERNYEAYRGNGPTRVSNYYSLNKVVANIDQMLSQNHCIDEPSA